MKLSTQFAKASGQNRRGFAQAAGPLGDWHALLELLRNAGFPITIDGEARFATLLWRLGEAGVSLHDAETAAQYLGPILCSSGSDQNRFREILADWYSNQTRSASERKKLSLLLERFDLRAIVGVALAVFVIIAANYIAWNLGPFKETTEYPVLRVPLGNKALEEVVEGVVSRTLFALPIIIALVVVLRRRRRHQARLARRAGETELVETFEIRMEDCQLFRSIRARTAVYGLKRSGIIFLDRIDIRRTIDATLRSFGWPVIHMAVGRINRELVLLVDVRGAADHLKLLGDALEYRLRSADTLLTRYDYRVSPGVLRLVSGRTDGPLVDSLGAVATRHLHQKLLIVSNGEGLFERTSAQLDPQVREHFAGFSTVIVFTPSPDKTWGSRERALLSAGIFVAPLNVKGLEQAADLAIRDPEESFIRLLQSIEEGADPFLMRLTREYYRYSSDQPPSADEMEQLGRRLHLWLGSDENFAVLAAVATFPKIDPKLTLVLARLVLGRQPDEELIALLARLPWMRDGRMPDWLRITLFNRLPESKQAMVAARILTMLNTARGRDGPKVLWRSLEEQIASLEVALPKKQLLGNLQSDMLDSLNPFSEHLFLSFMKGERLDPVADVLEPLAPNVIKRALGRDSDRRRILLVVAFTLCAAAMFAFQPRLSAVLITAWKSAAQWLRSWLQLPEAITHYVLGATLVLPFLAAWAFYILRRDLRSHREGTASRTSNASRPENRQGGLRALFRVAAFKEKQNLGPVPFGAGADVFISYAKADRPLALKLSAMLEAEGWKTWWDTSLTIGVDLRNKIMTELGRARAVIVIWTDASIKSDWVRSEAGRAQADRKLISVKLPHLTYRDLPPPFDALHTENVGEEDKIKAAVVAQLAKPQVEASPWSLLTKGFRYEFLTWFGIVGVALTLFFNLGAVLKLADWARVLVQHWKEWTHAFWLWTFGWLGIHVPPEWTPVLTFLAFGLLLTIGQATNYARQIRTNRNFDTGQQKSFKVMSWRTLYCLLFIVVSLLSVFPVIEYRIMGDQSNVYVLIGWFVAPPVIMILFAKQRLYAALSIMLMSLFFIILAFDQLANIGTSFTQVSTFYVSAMVNVLLLVLLSVAPAKAIARRLIFLALGLLLLIGLNELSKLGLDVTAPKLQG